MTNNKFYNLKVGSGARAARFVVDLKREIPAPEAKPAVKESKLEKLAEVDYGKYIKDRGEKTKNFIFNLAKPVKAFRIPGQARNDDLRSDGSLLNQLAFVSLGKFLFLAFYKICYLTGWTVVFILKLVYLLLSAPLQPAAKLFKRSFFRLAVIFHKFFKHLPADYQAARQAAMVAAVKSLRSAQKIAVSKIDKVKIINTGQVGYLKPVMVFAGVLLLIVLPVKAFTYYRTLDNIKGQVLGASESALNELFAGGQAAADFNFALADKSFSRAGGNFLNAQKELEQINGLIFSLAALAPDKNLRLAAAGPRLLKAGGLSAEAGKNLTLALEKLFNYQSAETGKMVENLITYGGRAVKSLNALETELKGIDSDLLPEDLGRQFILLKQKVGELNVGLKEFVGLADALDNFLGLSEDKRYLLVFQNNAELRASGGFIGSFATIDFSRGRIKNIAAPGGGSYDTDAGLLKKIKSPEPLTLVRADWHFWDANWWPDWPTSARKLAWFYENSDGSTVDGVISLTPTVMERLLKVIGPVEMKDKYGLVFNADNFWLETQKLSEQKPNITKEPKKIIGDLMNKIIEELPKRLDEDNFLPLLSVLEGSLNDKNILLYFADPELQTQTEVLGWGGLIKDTAGDYLSVINTNIAGGKSDRKITEQIIHQAEVQADGTIIVNLTVKRTHTGVKREPFSGVRNVDWLRIYVPLGSKLISAQGFKPVDKIFFKAVEEGAATDQDVAAVESSARTDEATGTKIYDEFNKTVFANWSQLDPGESIEVKVVYQLPFKLSDKKATSGELADRLITAAGAMIEPRGENLYAYSLLAQKQPGLNASRILSELKLSPNFQPVWRYPDDLAVNQSGWFYSQALNEDKIMAAVVEEK